MVKMDPTIRRKRTIPGMNRNVLVGIGTAFIALSIIMLGISLWEAFGSAARFRVIRVPGFHELKLDKAGAYVGLYQHRGTTPLPVRELSRLDVRVMSKGDFQEIPVLMNNSGQSFNRMGMQGMPVFNFVAPRAGVYTLSAAYLEESGGPTVSIMVFHQGVQDIKQTLAVGGLFFVLFITLGIWVIVKSADWSTVKA
jgi:hypothetical protein